MGYLSSDQIKEIGFKYIGKNVKISEKASIYDPSKIEIGDNCRIDDFCILSGKIILGTYIHMAPYTMLAGGEMGITTGKYVTFAYGVKVFSESDDYSGKCLVGSLVPRELKTHLSKSKILIGDYSIIGTNSTLMPQAILAEGVAVGAHSLVKNSLDSWGIYCGTPAIRIKSRSKAIKSAFIALHH